MCLSCLAAVNQPSLEDKATILRALPCISPRLLSITPLPHTRDARVRFVDLLGPLIETSKLQAFNLCRVLQNIDTAHVSSPTKFIELKESKSTRNKCM
jgi:hypothetical protein